MQIISNALRESAGTAGRLVCSLFARGSNIYTCVPLEYIPLLGISRSVISWSSIYHTNPSCATHIACDNASPSQTDTLQDHPSS